MKFTKTVIDWYSKNKRQMPWRETSDPYFIWLSEIILQQTQVVQGLPYYIAFTTTYPTVEDLAKADEQDVLKLWQGLGYYSRARNLHASAKYIVNELNGQFPSTYKDLLKLKGVGDYTASAIASICFNEVTAVVDGNVYRALSRYFGIATPINKGEGIKAFKILSQELIDAKQPATYNQAIMEFGAIQCKPKSPNCEVCPLNGSCYALQHKKVDALPVKIKANPVKKVHFNYIVIISKNNKTLIEQRIGKGIWENMYQFPLMESDKSESRASILKHVSEFDVLSHKKFSLSLYNSKAVIHKLSHRHLYTKFWIVQLDADLESGIPLEDLKNYPVPVLIENFIEAFNF